ncbi:MAG TPA: hypothetical protein PLY93_03250 [Turneriella sp.]|nr:hypothetical protein [Turneriella sp.]
MGSSHKKVKFFFQFWNIGTFLPLRVFFSLLFPLLLTSNSLQAEKSARRQELQYYRNEFEARYNYPIYDTLFEKIIWERKVSHIAMGIHGQEYRVTLLMMQEYPWNFKSKNYPIHFTFKSFKDAADKFHEMNHFLRNNGVMAVGLKGDTIIHEKILVAPVGNTPARPSLTDKPGLKDTDPILTRQPLPRRLPL